MESPSDYTPWQGVKIKGQAGVGVAVPAMLVGEDPHKHRILKICSRKPGCREGGAGEALCRIGERWCPEGGRGRWPSLPPPPPIGGGGEGGGAPALLLITALRPVAGVAEEILQRLEWGGRPAAGVLITILTSEGRGGE